MRTARSLASISVSPCLASLRCRGGFPSRAVISPTLQWLPWAALAAVTLLAFGLVLLLLRSRKPTSRPLPLEWALAGRPVFSTDERRIYRLLREALPHHIVLSKLPLVRFCQPTDQSEVRY